MMSSKALTHDQNRGKVCFLCFRKQKQMYIIENQLKIDMKNHVDNYDDERRLPAAVCCTCRRKVFQAKTEKKKLASPDLSIFKHVQATRSRCECKICEIAREIPAKICGKVAKKVPGKFSK